MGHEKTIRRLIARIRSVPRPSRSGGTRMWFSFRLFLGASRLLLRKRRDLMLENLALRHQLSIYQRSQLRPVLQNDDRRFWSTLARGWCGWRDAVSVVQPDTVVRWHRTAWRRYWVWKSRSRGRGRPRIAREVQALIKRMARENPAWGAVRTAGELRRARDRGQRLERSHVPAASLAPPAIVELAAVLAPPCPADLGGRLLHRADADLPNVVRLRAAGP